MKRKVLVVKKLLKLALMIGGVAAVARLVSAKKSQWMGLTEPQVREKLERRLPGRMPDEKRAEVADKVVSKMRERGVIREEDDIARAPGETESDTADSTEATDSDDSAVPVGDDSEDNAEST